MKIQKKISIIFILTWFFVICLTYFLAEIFLKDNYIKIENQFVVDNLKDIDSAMFAIYNQILLTNTDWSVWDDTYKFIHDLNAEYIKSNLILDSFGNLRVNVMMFFDENGNYKFGRFYDAADSKFIDKPEDIDSHVAPNSKLLQVIRSSSFITGMLKLKEGFLLVSSHAILRSDGLGPVGGALIMGRYLDKDSFDFISKITNRVVILYSSDEIQKIEKLRSIYQYLQNNEYYSLPKNDKEINGFAIIKDLYGKPVGMFEITLPRTIWMEGIKTLHYFTWFLLVIAFVSLLVLWMLNKLFVIAPLLRLNKEVANIDLKSKKVKHIEKYGKDEVSDISGTINSMLDALNGLYEERIKYLNQLQEINKNLVNEITERKEIEMKLRTEENELAHQSHHDSLTGLANKLLFTELLNHLLGDAKRHEKPLAVLFLDIDRFKKINDVFGHRVGDLFLQRLAAEFESRLRQMDFIARFSGDEFAFVVFDFQNLVSIEKVLVDILTIVSEVQVIKDQQFQLAASIGVAVYPEDGSTSEELISNAEIAMYDAKNAGGNKYNFFKGILQFKMKEELQMENDLYKAIKNHELKVFFQPIIDLITTKIVGMEALVRWEHPKLGLLLPMSFIPVAEKVNLIIPLGIEVLILALRTYKKWIDIGFNPGFITVNFSASQFHDKNFLNLIKRELLASGVSGENLIVEITESIFIGYTEEVINKLQELDRMGIRIAIDDFGIGYSSLGYLQKFPITFLKIDREFIRNLQSDKDSQIIVNAIITLGHALNFKVIAEGVEDNEQFMYLRSHDCDMIQGYLISEPIKSESTKAFTMKYSEAQKIASSL